MLDELNIHADRFAAFAEACSDAIWIFDPQTRRFEYLSPSFDTIFGHWANALRGDPECWDGMVFPTDIPVVAEHRVAALRGEHSSVEYRIVMDDGQIRWLIGTTFPLNEGRNAGLRVGGIVRDVTDRRQAMASQRSSDERLRLALKSGRMGTWEWDVRSGKVVWSDEHYRIQGYTPGEVAPSYQAWLDRIDPLDRDGCDLAVRTAMAERIPYDQQFRVLWPDGTLRWCSAHGIFIYEDDQPVQMIGVMRDVTEEHEWVRRQEALVAELQHRTRNLMAVVQAITVRSLAQAQSLDDFAEPFQRRLAALGRAQSLLSRREDASRVCFEHLIHTELEATGAPLDRVRLAGPDGVPLRSSMVQTLAMALHELATNALKYGALRDGPGQLMIEWQVQDTDNQRLLHIDWRESGVDMVRAAAMPRGSGQGRMLIERALPYQLGASTRYRMMSDGIHCQISLPVSHDYPGEC